MAMQDSSVKVTIKLAGTANVGQILKLIAGEAKASGAVTRIGKAELDKWISNGLSYVAIHDGQVIGHEGANVWPQSRFVELRSAVVNKEYRGRGIGEKLNGRLMLKLHSKYGGWHAIAFVNSAARSRGMLERAGFAATPAGALPESYVRENGNIDYIVRHGYTIFTMIV
jgi:N-acetylglutamate synthase-like GNAT family acetyltransferase